MNVVEIDPDSAVRLIDILMEPMRKEFFQHHLMLIYTGMSRTAYDVAKSQIESIPQKEQVMREFQDVVSEANKILADTGDLNDFGRLLHESWLLKKTSAIRSPLALWTTCTKKPLARALSAANFWLPAVAAL